MTADEPIVELETDKANVEVPSPSNGSFGKYIAVKEGETVNAGALLGMINGASTKALSSGVIKKYFSKEKNKFSKREKEQQVLKSKTSTEYF